MLQRTVATVIGVALAGALTVLAPAAQAAASKGSVDVLNWWTSGSESESMAVLQKLLKK